MPAAKGQGKTRSWLTKNQQELQKKESLQNRTRGKKRTNILHRVQSRNNSNVDDLIYGFLGNLAAINGNERRSKSKSFKAPGVKIKRQGRSKKKPNKTNVRKKINSLSFAPSESARSTDDTESVSTTMDSATSRASSFYDCNDSTANDTDQQEPVDSKKGVKQILKRRSLIEIINNYIKDGIKADVQKAKRYMKKALSFGVKTGYLKPLDNSGHLLEVSMELPGVKFNCKKDTVAERKRRKNMRRGIVNFDDYNSKAAKKKVMKKDAEKSNKETNTNASKKRGRSQSTVNESTSKTVNKRNDKKPPPKKKTKIARQSRPAARGSRKMQRRRSPTPWRNSNLETNEEKDDERAENDNEKSKTDKNDNESNNSVAEMTTNQQLSTTFFRREDSKNHHQDSCAHGSSDNFPPKMQLSMESTEEVDKQ